MQIKLYFDKLCFSLIQMQTFKDGGPLDYMDLVDGVLLNEAMAQMWVWIGYE